MAASATDLFKKGARKWVGQIGAGGVANGTAQTIPLSSTTNLPTDTAVVAVIDRVDSNGTKTPSLEETVIGVVSGSNLINCVRGAEGTAQAHDAGDVVEILLTNKGWNDVVDGLLVEHLQTGRHGDVCATSLTMTASGIIQMGSSAASLVRDTNANELLKFTQTASAINEFTVANSVAGSGPALCATGGDTNISMNLVPKGTGRVQDTSVTIPTISSTDTLTNKRITKRITTITSHATPTVNTDNCDTVTITAQAESITSMTTNLSGTPTDFQTLIFRIKDNGTGRAITWGASFEAKGVALPTTTTANKVLTVGFIYDTVSAKWGCVASANEA